MFKYTDTSVFNENTSHGLIANRIKNGERILEFGCSKGDLAKYVTENLDCSVCGVEISSEALSVAKQYLDKAILADIELYEWESELVGELFDVIVFSDVLEHLKNPELALKTAKKYLKEDGRILFSVPNIAHADIISKLLDNRFDYTDIGLLDNTHIHFWGIKNLPDFCKSAGLFLQELTATHAAFGTTEQRSQRDILTERVIEKYENHDIYQLVCVAYNDDYARTNGLTYKYNVSSHTNPFTTVYFDRGSGFSEGDFKNFYDIEKNRVNIVIDDLSGIEKIRVDLRENGGYLAKNVSFEIDGKPTVPSLIVNSFATKYGYALTKNDPCQIFEIPANAKSFSVKADIVDLIDIENLSETMEEFIIENNSLSSDLKIKSDNLKITQEALDITRNDLKTTHEALEFTRDGLKATQATLDHYKLHYETAIEQREDLKRQLACAKMEYDIISNAAFWKITKPLRVLFDFLKRIPVLKAVYKTLKSIKQHGFKYTFKKIRRKLKTKSDAAQVLYTPKDLEKQRKTKFDKDVKFSILVPLYNTPEKYLREMIDSVRNQTYAKWELCLADGSDTKHTKIEKICKDYAKKDERIKYRRLEKNLGISGNTNACIDMSTGNYTALFDHDDLLHPAALYEVMRAICEKNADFIYTDENTFHDTPKDAYCPHYKPDFSPDTLRSYNYICHFTVFKSSLLEKTGGFRPEFDGSQDYDMVLRLTEQAENIVHIPIILYYWRAHKNSVASDISAKPYTIVAAKKALAEHLDRLDIRGEVEDSSIPSTYRIKYEVQGEPLISIIIPNKDHVSDLDLCLKTIQERSTYRNFEVIVVENNSTEKETFEYYDVITEKYGNVKVVKWDYEFNYSKINNFGFKYASGDYVVLLNNDVEILTPDWLEEMLMFVQRKDVGAAGMMLYYSDDTIQHAGVIIGIGGVAGHSHKYFKRGDYGYASRLTIAQNLSAVTAAAVMIRSDVFREVSGLDDSFAVAFNDVDLCLRIREAGYLIVWTPYSEAYHYESKSRGLEDTPEKQERFKRECDRFYDRWDGFLKKGDPYYNPNLTLEREDFSTR